MDKAVLFWILFAGLAFAFALAVQMRVITALVLRRALKAWRATFDDRVKANQAVIIAAGKAPVSADIDTDVAEAATHLRNTYPMPLNHLRKARRYSVVVPVLLVILAGLGRTVLGVI